MLKRVGNAWLGLLYCLLYCALLLYDFTLENSRIGAPAPKIDFRRLRQGVVDRPFGIENDVCGLFEWGPTHPAQYLTHLRPPAPSLGRAETEKSTSDPPPGGPEEVAG